MSTPTTNYLVLNPYTGVYNDLGQLFRLRNKIDPSANLTGFQYFDPSSNTQLDIKTLFYPYSTSPVQLAYSTNMAALGGKDLSLVFTANPFIVNGAYTLGYDNSNDYYTIAFANYLSTDPLVIGNGSSTATLQFLTNVKGVIFTAVAGGGGGGGGTGYNAGGGGAGGDWGQYSVSGTVAPNTVYNITVGGGGTGSDPTAGDPSNAGGQGGTSSVSSNGVSLLSMSGGNGGTATKINNTVPGGVGVGNGESGGNGGVGGATAPTNGVSQTTTIAGYTGGTACYYGGGGAGGTVQFGTPVDLTAAGGLGGGAGTFANSGQSYTGVTYIKYPASKTPTFDGLPATGGGAAGGNAQLNFPTVVPPTKGGQGASGIVLCCFQLA